MHERLEALKPFLSDAIKPLLMEETLIPASLPNDEKEIEEYENTEGYKKAVEALKEYRAEFPDDWDGKLMEGFIAYHDVMGNFPNDINGHLYDEITAVLNSNGQEADRIKTSPLWEDYYDNIYASIGFTQGMLAASAHSGPLGCSYILLGIFLPMILVIILFCYKHWDSIKNIIYKFIIGV